jgi:hypothetical protein
MSRRKLLFNRSVMGTSFSAWFWPVLCRHLAPPRAAACSPFPGFAFCILHFAFHPFHRLRSWLLPPAAACCSIFQFCILPDLGSCMAAGSREKDNTWQIPNAKCKTGKCKVSGAGSREKDNTWQVTNAKCKMQNRKM